MDEITRDIVVAKGISRKPIAWASNADLTYSRIVDQTVDNEKAIQSKLDGSLIRNSKLHNVDLSRCDLDGSRIENSKLTNVRFRNCDIISVDASKTVFKNCDFREVHLQDCHFQHCSFIDCDFRNSTVIENIFARSSFVRCNIQSSTTDLNKYDGSIFFNMLLGDCSLAYNIYVHCKYKKVRINVDGLGLNYGFSSRDLQQFELLFLGKLEQKVGRDLEETIAINFKERGWFFQLSIFMLNVSDGSTLRKLAYVFETLLVTAEAGIRTKRNEVVFLINILKFLNTDDSLPLGFVVFVKERIRRIQRLDCANAYDDILNLIMIWDMDKVAPVLEMIDASIATHQSAKFEIGFGVKPEIQLGNLIVDISRRLPQRQEIDLLSFRSGSYIEMYDASIFMIAEITALLVLLNGLFGAARNFIDNFKKIAGLFDHRKKDNMNEAAEIVSQTTRYLLAPRDAQYVSLQGYESSNIKWICLVNGAKRT